MGTSRRGVPAATPPALPALPPDVQLHILHQLSPAQLAVYAQLSRAAAALVRTPSVWGAVARRHLALVPDHPSARAVRALARALVCRWWLLTGLFVPGVPVHRRSGFCDVTARGGVELPIAHPAQPSCYVFGGPHRAAAVPVINPSVSLCFFLDPAGPFPLDGMRLALVHAAELPQHPQDLAPPIAHLTLEPSATAHPVEATPAISADDSFAEITVKVNNVPVLTSFRPHPHSFQVTHVHVPADVLVTKPRVNHISVEFDPLSTAAYWLKDVSIMPSILPPPASEKHVSAIRIGEPLPEEQPQPPSHPHAQPQTQARLNLPPAAGRAPSTPRRAVRRLPDHTFKQFQVDTHLATRYSKSHVGSPPKPKHMYHHNYFRSPRRSSPTSPRSRSGR